jgi:hypothetical protein
MSSSSEVDTGWQLSHPQLMSPNILTFSTEYFVKVKVTERLAVKPLVTHYKRNSCNILSDRTMDEVQNPVNLSVVHSRQNHLESTSTRLHGGTSQKLILFTEAVICLLN